MDYDNEDWEDSENFECDECGSTLVRESDFEEVDEYYTSHENGETYSEIDHVPIGHGYDVCVIEEADFFCQKCKETVVKPRGYIKESVLKSTD
jgi:ribosomal protein S27E